MRDTIVSINPNTGEVLGSVPVCTESGVQAAVVRARRAQQEWAARSLSERIRVLREVQESLVDHADEIASLVSQEMGKLESEALATDILLSLASLSGYLKLAPRVLRNRRLGPGLLHITKRYLVVHQPLGVVAVISPFNFPVLLSMQSVFAALIAGNAVVHKPSEFTSLTALKVQEILGRTALPEDLFQVVTGYGETGDALLHAGVDHVSFTGSSATGRKVACAAGEQMISAILELGGNNAMIVLDDAPIERAVNSALTFAFATNGQMCGSVARLLVHESIADDFIDRLSSRLADWRASTSTGPGTGELTALIDEAALARVEAHVKAALASGARLIHGGGRLETTDAPVCLPTLIVDVQPEMAVVREETFGPVVSVIRIPDDEAAVRLANDTAYGLTASVWSRDRQRAWNLARKLDVGTVAVNDHLWAFFAPEVPWGGVKSSGIGRIGGEWGLRAMTYPKVVSFERLIFPRELYFLPVSALTHEVFRQLIPLLYSRLFSKRLAAGARLLKTLFRRRSELGRARQFEGG